LDQWELFKGKYIDDQIKKNICGHSIIYFEETTRLNLGKKKIGKINENRLLKEKSVLNVALLKT